MTRTERPLAAVALVLLPVLFLVAELTLRAHALPYWLWFNLDPSYLYLLDGMQVLQGVPPGNVDHPGTPVQCIVAAVLWLSGLGTPAAIPDAAFAAAELVLARASTVMLTLDAAALFVLGWTAWRRIGGLVPALFAETAPFITMLTLKHGIEVEPEPMLLFSVALLASAMIAYATGPRAALIVAMAVIVGFGSACKITFAPLGLAPLLLVAGWRRRGLLLVLTALAFAVFLLPAAGGAARAASWFGHLALGAGVYGAGPPIVVDPGRYPHAVAKLFFARPLFIVPFFLAAGVLWARRRRGLALAGPPRALAAILAAQLVQILLVAKHPSGHYILPALELGGPSLALLWPAARALATQSGPRRRIELGFAAALAIILVAQAVAFAGQDRELARARAAALTIDTARDFPRCAHVFLDMASSPSQAWLYNFNFGPHPYGPRLAALLPAQDYTFLSWVGHLENASGQADPAAVMRRYPCVALRGTNLAALQTLARGFSAAAPAVCQAGSEFILALAAPCPHASGL